eukprot:478722-Ditylum_brightwellii.AAC.1
MMMQNDKEHKSKSVRNRSKGGTRLNSSSSSINISDDKYHQGEDKKVKAKAQQPKKCYFEKIIINFDCIFSPSQTVQQEKHHGKQQKQQQQH